jgi:hypothetical protein
VRLRGIRHFRRAPFPTVAQRHYACPDTGVDLSPRSRVDVKSNRHPKSRGYPHTEGGSHHQRVAGTPHVTSAWNSGSVLRLGCGQGLYNFRGKVDIPGHAREVLKTGKSFLSFIVGCNHVLKHILSFYFHFRHSLQPATPSASASTSTVTQASIPSPQASSTTDPPGPPTEDSQVRL